MKYELIGKDNGSARIDPSKAIEVAGTYRWTITYTAGKHGIAIGGGIRVGIPVHFTRPQFVDPNALGHTVAYASNGATRTEIRLRDTQVLEISDPGGNLSYPCGGYALPGDPDLWIIPHPWAWRFYIKVLDSPLADGDTITVGYGTNGAQPGTVAPRTAYFRIATDTDAKRNGIYSGYSLLSVQPTVQVRPGPPMRLIVVVPSHLDVGQSTVVSAVGMDEFDNPAASIDSSIIAAEGVDTQASAPDFERFSGAREGLFQFRGEWALSGQGSDQGFGRVRVRSADSSLHGASNPVRISPNTQEKRLFWGDLHGHTFCSDGLGTLDEYYSYAREISKLDITAATDHSQYMSDDEWRETQDSAKRYYTPGEFVTFSAYEYSHNPPTAPYYGDKNFYFLDDDNEIYRANNVWRGYWSDFAEVLDKIPIGRTMIIPHAHASAMDAGFDPRFMPVVEMRSMHGTFEMPQAPVHHDVLPACDIPLGRRSGRSLQELLDKGLKVGVIASGDGHEGHPGHPAYGSMRKNFGALMGVWAEDLTRESIWKALWERSCYATTGERIYLEFSINSARMGSEIEIEAPRVARVIRAVAAGVNQIETIEVIKDNRVFHSQTVYGDSVEIEIADEEFSRGTDFYYLRVKQIDGNMAWSSPIWVKLPAEKTQPFPHQIVRI
jgi:hypothetical protein